MLGNINSTQGDHNMPPTLPDADRLVIYLDCGGLMWWADSTPGSFDSDEIDRILNDTKERSVWRFTAPDGSTIHIPTRRIAMARLVKAQMPSAVGHAGESSA